MQRRQQPTRSARVELRQVLDRNRIVLGQPVVAQVVLDTTAGGVDGFEWIDAPSYPGWWAQRVEPPERITGEVVEVEGVRYNRFVVAEHVLVPLKTGSLTVPAVGARIGFRSASLFAPQQVVERTTSQQVVEVTPRPQAPEGFSGAVGDLRYRASLHPERVAFGESAVLSIALEGSGNLPLVEAPALWPQCTGCESYPPEEESSVTVDNRGIHGTRVWRTTLVPRSAGELELTPVELAVFDPAAGTYRKQVLGPMTLVVDAPPATPIPAAEPLLEAAGEEARPPAADDPAEGPEAGPPQWLWLVGALTVGVLVGGVVTLLVARRRHVALPPRQNGESPAERARQLQVALEQWWLVARTKARGEALEEEMQALRRELEAVRFAPGRADHSETVRDLEDRVRGLMRRA
jgi:gas vesicle protein